MEDYTSQYDKRICMTQNCFGKYEEFDKIQLMCSICSRVRDCKIYTRFLKRPSSFLSR
ncbi:hypothetical protein ES707_11621 [subsurface metagenome]